MPATMAISGMLVTTAPIAAIPITGMPSNEPARRPSGRPSNKPAGRPTGMPANDTTTAMASPSAIGVVGGMAAAMLGEQERRCEREQSKGKYREK